MKPKDSVYTQVTGEHTKPLVFTRQYLLTQFNGFPQGGAKIEKTITSCAELPKDFFCRPRGLFVLNKHSFLLRPALWKQNVFF